VNTTIEKIERLNLILLGICTAFVWISGWLHAPSFLLGGGVMQLNFWLLKKIVRALVVPVAVQEKRGTVRALVVFLGKILLSLLLLSGLFLHYPIQVWSFMAGVSLLLVTCMIVTLLVESPAGPQVEDNGA
jgi:small-conductance mechanosensitive channel